MPPLPKRNESENPVVAINTQWRQTQEAIVNGATQNRAEFLDGSMPTPRVVCFYCKAPRLALIHMYALNWAVMWSVIRPDHVLAIQVCTSCLVSQHLIKASDVGLSDAVCAALPLWPA